MNKCCLKSFWAYVQKQYSENWKTYTWMLLIEAILLLVINFIDFRSDAPGNRFLDAPQLVLYVMFGLIFTIGAVHVSMKDNYGRNGVVYNTMPVSQTSRFMFGFVNSIVLFVLFTIVFMLCTLPWADSLASNNKALWSLLSNIGEYRYSYLYIYLFFCCHSSYMFIESLIKRSVLASYALCNILLGLLVVLPNIFAITSMGDLNNSPSRIHSMHHVISGATTIAFDDMSVVSLLLDIIMYTLAYILPLVLYVSAYFKFRERQIK